MGGGDNELIIKSVLDNTGFTKGSKQLKGAINSLTNSMKSMFGRVVGVASVFGVLSKAVSTFMSQNQELTKQMNGAWTALGNALGPIITQIVNWVTQAISYLVEFMRLLGLTSKSASQASKAAKAAGGSLQRTVAGFDELNKLSAGGGGGDSKPLEDREAPQWIKDIADFLKHSEWEKAGAVLAQKLNDVVSSVNWEEIGAKIGYFFDGALKFLATFITQFDWMNLASKLTEGINGFMDSVDWGNLAVIMTAKFRIVLLSLVGFINTFDWKGFGKAVGDYFKGAFNSLTDTIKKVDWGKLGSKLWEALKGMLEGVDWEGLLRAAFEFLGSAVGAISALLLEFCAGIIEDLVDGIYAAIDFFGKKIEDAGGDIGAGILEGIKEIWANIKNWIRDNILQPFINGFKSVFQIGSPSKLMEEQGVFIIEGLLQGLKNTWRSISDWLSGLWTDFSSAIGSIASSAWNWGADLIQNLWNGINSQLSGFFSGIRSVAQGIRNFLGFSEPKEGPLSDFHTYGPDMMELYAQGIEGSSGKVLAAVSEVAEGVADGLDGNPASISAVASGAVVPYGVAGMYASESKSADLGAVVNELSGLINDFRASIGNMQVVAQFGDFRLIAQKITTIQKQMERANG